MRKFKHFDAESLEEATSLLEEHESAKIIAGGTDILGLQKDYVEPDEDATKTLINIKTIPNLEYIKEEGDMLKIGGLTRLHDISKEKTIQENYTALAQAARQAASPHLREMGTIAGNICQETRCWYYRAAHNRFNCVKKGGDECYADDGDDRYHSIFGDVEDCRQVNPSDTAPALIALNTKIKTTKRTLEIEDIYQDDKPEYTIDLDDNEIIKEFQIPTPGKNTKSSFKKFALRKSIDFPIVNCASSVKTENNKVQNCRICLNAVYFTPYSPNRAEEALTGQTLNEENAQQIGDAAVWEAKALDMNEYKIKIAKTLVKRTLLACKQTNTKK